MSLNQTAAPQAPVALTGPLILLMSMATGLAVASNYYAQPLLATMATYFSLTVHQAGLIVTTAQLGYAVGLMFIVPLGDLVEQRKLIVVMTVLAALGLLLTGTASSMWAIVVGTALTGLFSVVAQILVPLSATLAKPEERGRVVGILMSGLMLGILLARTLAGALAELGSWRTVYWVASIMMLVVAVMLWRGLPQHHQNASMSYPKLLRSIVQLFVHEPVLRTRAILGGLAFANFSVLWTSIAFLLASPAYGYSEFVIGLFGLIGVAGAIGASKTGKLVDKGHAKYTTVFGFVVVMLSWLPIWWGQYALVPLLIGVFFLDLAVPAVHITNQTMIYQTMPEARGRLTAGYMTSYFIGGAVGSVVAGMAYQYGGWDGVALIGGVLSLLGVLWALKHKALLG
ncbi:MAG: MFS transporter [Neisseriaceae bacterium]|nr:MFS transporter [Neisseriaceae bacterium]